MSMFPDGGTDGGPTAVTVATFNTAAGNRRFASRGGFAAGFDDSTEVILHQEICSHRRGDVVDPAPDGVRRRLAWAFGGLVPGCGDPSTRSYGNALRVAWDSTEPVHEHRFETIPDGDHVRGAVLWRGRLGTTWVTVASTHLSPGRGTERDVARRAQQRELLEAVASVSRSGDALIVGGDFNSRVTSVMSANGLGLRRVTPAAMIDQIWTTGIGLRSWTVATDRSDHPIVYATVELAMPA